MTTQAELTTITGPEAYAKAVEHAQHAEEHVGVNSPIAQQHAAVSQAYAAIARAEAAARGIAKPGYLPEGGWDQHTHPNNPTG